MGLNLTGVTAMCPRARHINPCLVLVQPRKTHPDIIEKLTTGTSNFFSPILPFVDQKPLKRKTNKDASLENTFLEAPRIYQMTSLNKERREGTCLGEVMSIL